MIQHPLFRRGVAVFAAALSGALLAACQTTGNPREGGLFGWSEDQARQRQATFEADSKAAREEADAEVARGAALSARQGQLRSDVSEMQAHLARLLAENDKLAGDIRRLMSQRQVSSDELTRLRGALATSEQARADARRAAAEAASSQAASQLAQHSENVSRHNQQLHREVLLLMGR